MIKKVLSLCVALATLLSMGVLAQARDRESPVVKVGFPIQGGISYLDENGDYAGYLVDYLEQLNLFMDWEIQYVQAEGDLNTQISTLMEQLLSGEIDMLGTMNRNAALEKMFLYPSYSYGTSHTVLAVRDDSQWIAEDYTNWDGMKVAVFPGISARMELLEQYAQVNGFTYETVEYAEQIDCVNAVRNGEADATLQVDLSLVDQLRSVGRFAPNPYYFALSRESEDLLPQLNNALDIVGKSYENFQTELYEYYYGYSTEFLISEENKDYIKSLGTLQVLFFEGDAPFQYVKDGILKGFAVEYFDSFAQSVGLSYEPVLAESIEEAGEMIEDGKVDLIACAATDSDLIYLNGIRFALPYWNSLRAYTAMGEYHGVQGQEVEVRANAEGTLNRMLEDPTYIASIDMYSLNYYLRKNAVYEGITVGWADTREYSYAVGVNQNIDDQFIAILNQYTSTVSSATKQAMLAQYVADDVEYTAKELLITYGAMILVGLLLVVLLVGIAVLYVRNRRNAYQKLLTENKLLHLSLYDELTGAYNGTHFRKLLEEACMERRHMVLFAFNIRNFKYINDTYGVKEADHLLCRIKELLDYATKENEFFCRQSADLFYVVLQESEMNHAILRFQQIMASIQGVGAEYLDGYVPHLYCGAVPVHGSPAPYGAPANINFVLTALAYAKKEGIHQVYVYNEELHQADQMRQYIESHMESALEREEFLLYLQPKKNLKTGKIDSAEALVRWQPADRGMIFPDQFIPMFEENGFCKRLDLYMVEQACKKIRSWMDRGLAPISISINQTKALFVSDDYVENLLRITEQYQVSPRYITLEILEGLAFENIDMLNQTIDKLHEEGFRVSMDDFGAGYSSLNTLGALRIDELKIDRMFLMQHAHEETKKKVLAAVLPLAKELGINTVAEGVETLESEDVIRSMSCDYGQGYYYSKPIPVEEFEKTYLKK